MITEYHRPRTVDDALALIAHPDTVILGGGTTVSIDHTPTSLAVVDLQAVGLSGIEASNDAVRIGATTPLQDIVDSDLVPSVLRDLARHEAPNTIRNVATIGGTIATAHPESQFLAGLLAYGASVDVARSDSVGTYSVEEILGDPGLLSNAIIVDVTLTTGGTAAADRTGRTPMDLPIVMAVAHSDTGGAIRLAMTGIGSTPLIVDPDHLEDLDPPADFRGSSAYRSQLAKVLAKRVIDTVSGGASR